MAPALRKRLAAILAVILAVDVAGYSRLIGEDEPATVAATGEYRDIVSGHIEANGGRVVNVAGL